MQLYDYNKLKGKMRELGLTQEKLAREIGISPCSLNLTLNNKRNFRQEEIKKACEVLGLASNQIEPYFFTTKP